MQDTLKQEFNNRYDEAFRAWDSFLHEAKKDLDFVTGDVWNAQEKEYLRRNRREALNWNKTKRIIKLITGYQRKNRLGWKAQAQEGAEDKAASQYTDLLLHAMDQCGGYHTMSDAFEQGSLKTGINLVEIGVDYSEDPVSGDIDLYNIPYNRFLMDPNISRRDLSDCGYLLRREWVTKNQAKNLFPSRAGEIEKITPAQTDNKFTFALKSQGADERLRWDEYWRRDTEKRTIIVDPQSGEWKFWPKKSDKQRLDLFLQQNPQVITREIYQPTVKLAVFIEDEVFYDGPDPLEIGDFPFVPLMGDWNPEHEEHGKKLMSKVRDIRDPQRELNKRRSKILDIMDSQINSGWMAEEGAVVNPKDMYQAGQGKVIWTIKNALANRQVQAIQPPAIPSGLMQFAELMDKDIMEIPGANNELLGIPEKDQTQTPGLLAKLRQSQGLTTLQDVFDNYRLSKDLLGQKLLKTIQQTYTPDKIQKILGEEPVQEFFDKDFGKYKIYTTEGVLTDSQRQMYYSELTQLKQMGAPIPWAAILKASPMQKKDELQEVVAQEEEKAAKEQEHQRRLEEVQVKAMLAKTREDVAGSVEKTAQAQEDRADAAYRRVKTAKEVQKMDSDRLKTLAEAMSVLSSSQQQEQQFLQQQVQGLGGQGQQAGQQQQQGAGGQQQQNQQAVPGPQRQRRVTRR